MIKTNAQTALLLIDIQKGFYDEEFWGGNRNNPDLEDNVETLLNFWRQKKYPVFHAKHCSTNPNSKLVKGQEGNDFMDVALPLSSEPVYEKDVNSAFIGTQLKADLDKAGIVNVVVAGLTTDHCVSTTARMAANLGYNTFIVNDACATFDKIGFNGEIFPSQLIHSTALASLIEEFGVVLNTADILKA